MKAPSGTIASQPCSRRFGRLVASSRIDVRDALVEFGRGDILDRGRRARVAGRHPRAFGPQVQSARRGDARDRAQIGTGSAAEVDHGSRTAESLRLPCGARVVARLRGTFTVTPVRGPVGDSSAKRSSRPRHLERRGHGRRIQDPSKSLDFRRARRLPCHGLGERVRALALRQSLQRINGQHRRGRAGALRPWCRDRAARPSSEDPRCCRAGSSRPW